MKATKIVVSINTSWNIVNFRSGLIRALRQRGVEVVALSPPDAYTDRLVALGCRHVALAIDKKGTNPLRDAGLFFRYLVAFSRERPAMFLGWTVKPNIYGSLAAQLLGVPVINNISGLGTAFLNTGWLNRIVRLLYRVTLARSARVFFQNPDDLSLFVSLSLVRSDQAVLLPGSGVDLSHFAPPLSLPRNPGAGLIFLLVARLLWDKGIAEYVEAARLVRAAVPSARFQLLGFLDEDNRTAVPREAVDLWVREGVVEYLGCADDVRPYLTAADCVVLPSYREGTPRSLLEAAAMARPLIATDVPGCRDVVEDGINGWLCRSHDAVDLADRMLRLAHASEEERAEMGRRSRIKVESEYSESLVIEAYLTDIDVLLLAGQR